MASFNPHRWLMTKVLSLIFFLTFGWISACTPTPTPSPPPGITSGRAIDIAIVACKIPHLVLIGEPQNIRTKLLTLQEAAKLTEEEGETQYYEIPMDTMVWLVQMDGQLQLVGGPAPVVTDDRRVATPTSAQPFWGTCSVILDANSGRVISIRG